MMRLSSVLVAAACLTALASVSTASASFAGPHIPRWSGSAITVNMDDSAAPGHIVGYFDEPGKRSLMQMDSLDTDGLFGYAMSMLCSGNTISLFNSTDCFQFGTGAASCFVNPMDFRSAEQEGSCGQEGQQLWVDSRGAQLCLGQNSIVKKLGIADEDSFEINTFRWFKRSVSSQAAFWAPPAYCKQAHQMTLLSSMVARQREQPNTLSGLARAMTRMAEHLN